LIRGMTAMQRRRPAKKAPFHRGKST